MILTNHIQPEKGKIAKIWNTHNSSCMLVIPKDIAKEEGIDIPSYVEVTKTIEGILIKKLVLGNNHNREPETSKKIDLLDSVLETATKQIIERG